MRAPKNFLLSPSNMDRHLSKAIISGFMLDLSFSSICILELLWDEMVSDTYDDLAIKHVAFLVVALSLGASNSDGGGVDAVAIAATSLLVFVEVSSSSSSSSSSPEEYSSRASSTIRPDFLLVNSFLPLNGFLNGALVSFTSLDLFLGTSLPP